MQHSLPVDNDDCHTEDSLGWCVQINPAGDKECTISCVDKCPNGYNCVAIQNAGTDGLLLCMPQISPACNSCTEDADCTGMPGARCLTVGSDSEAPDLRCAIPCYEDGTCDSGYTCSVIPGDGEDFTLMCTPDTGSCICFGQDEAGNDINGSEKPCQTTNR